MRAGAESVPRAIFPSDMVRRPLGPLLAGDGASGRPESWNCSAESRKDHHGNIATQPMINESCAQYVTLSFKVRQTRSPSRVSDSRNGAERLSVV